MPGIDYFAGGSTATVIKAPASVTASANGAGIDISSYIGMLMIIAAIAKIAGTTPTMDVHFETTTDANVVITNTYSGTGNGTITEVKGGPDTVAEDITIHMDSATGFTVTGSVSTAIGTGTVGTKFVSSKIEFMITAGSTAFVHTDGWTIHTHARTWTNIADAAFTQVTTVNGIQRLTINSDSAGRWIRPVLDIDGTDSPEYIVGLTAYGLQN